METKNMMYKYIYFERIGDTGSFYCRSHHGGHLGNVLYYHNWHQYIFEPESHMAVFSKGCLEDIADFLGRLNKEKR